LERWLEKRSEVEDAVISAGVELEHAGYRAQLSEASVRSGLFDIRLGRRLPFAGKAGELRARVRDKPETLSPNVVLRPLIQDYLLPNAATIAGPTEIAYHAQLAPAYAHLDLSMPVLVPRFEATLVPAGVFELAARRGAPAWDFVFDFDGAMRATSLRSVPESLGDAVSDLERAIEAQGEKVREAASAMDPKLEGFARETQRRLGETLERFRGRMAEAARDVERARDPKIRNYREFLKPYDRPQERVLSALTLFLTLEDPLQRILETAGLHWKAVRDRTLFHWLIELPRDRGRTAA
jgi:uncharacterized protein YllA (UPF0747 family)